MKTTLFIALLLILDCTFSVFAANPYRPNGWYYIIDMETDSLSVDPIVRVEDFSELVLDSAKDVSNDNIIYRIVGKVDEAKRADWSIATKKAIGTHIGFLFDDVILTAPYVNGEIPNGNFFISTDKVKDVKLLYRQMCKEAGCPKKYGKIEDPGLEQILFPNYWLLKAGLIIALLGIVCLGLLMLRRTKRKASLR